MTIYNQLVNEIYDAHNIELDKTKIELMVLYYGAIFVNSCNVQLKSQTTNELEIINNYSMIFSPSSSGKDFLKNTTSKYFRKILNNSVIGVNRLIDRQKENGICTLPEEYQEKQISDYEYSLLGSRQGIYMLSLLVSESAFGSLNITINEFSDILKQKNNLNLLKELYDGVMPASIIQGEKDTDIRKMVQGLPTNVLIYGTPVALKQDQIKLKEFKQIIQTGLYRRSLMYYEPIRKMIRKKSIQHDTSIIADAYNEMFFRYGIDKEKSIRHNTVVLEFDDKAIDLLDTFDKEMFQRANDYLEDELIPLDRNAVKVIEKIAAIIHWLDMQETSTIKEKYVEQAINIFNRTRAGVYDLFKQTPVFELIYKYIASAKRPVTQADIITDTGVSVTEYKQNIEFLDEVAYKFNTKVVEKGTKLKEFSIEPYEINKLDKIIISVPTRKETKPEFTIDFTPMEVSMWDGPLSILNLVQSNTPCFTLCHYKQTAKTERGHRGEDNFIPCQNMIAFDFDGGVSIDEVKELVSQYKYIIYTTRNNQKDKNGIVCDRFRLLMPTKTEFKVSPEEHKQMYENIAEFLGFKIYDKATRNVSRLWFINKDGEVFYQKDGGLLDVRVLIDRTNDRENFVKKDIDIDPNEIDKRLYGMIQYTRNEAYHGNRNNTLFKLKKFMDDMGVDDDKQRDILNKVNNSLQEPLPAREINTILRGR